MRLTSIIRLLPYNEPFLVIGNTRMSSVDELNDDLVVAIFLDAFPDGIAFLQAYLP